MLCVKHQTMLRWWFDSSTMKAGIQSALLMKLSLMFFIVHLAGATKVSPTDGLFSVTSTSSNNEQLTAEKVLTRVEDQYTSWSAWTPCSKSCTQQRFRRCKQLGKCSEDVITAERTCFRSKGRCSARRLPKKQTTKSIEDIVYDLLYYDWSEWSACTRSCKKRRFRTCALKRWCKHTVLLEEKDCYAAGTNCEKRYMFTDPNDYEKYSSPAQENDGKGDDSDHGSNKGSKGDKKKPHRRKPRPNAEETSDVPINWDPATCGQRNVTGSYRIVGGIESRRGSWPWQVAIMTKWKEQYCGGALIAPGWVLTAAHCVRKKGRRRRVLIRTGEYDLSVNEGPEITHRSTTDFVHSDFDIDTIDSDIALLKLRNPVSPSAHVNFACVPEESDILPSNTLCYAVGWGKMKDTHVFGADVLREAQVPLVDNQKCSDAFDYEITKNQMCAGYNKGGVDTCAGDSGGPLMCQIKKNGVSRWYVYGVTSFGEGCGDRGKFGIYTRVTNFVKWISSVINDNTGDR